MSARPRNGTRLLVVIACVATSLATAAIPIVAGGVSVRPQLALAAAAILVLAVALAGWAPGFTLATIALGAEYALRLRGRNEVDSVAIVEAVALFATVELGLRARDARSIAVPDADVRRRGWWRLVAMLAGAAVSAFVVVAVGARRLPAPSAAHAFGLAAAAALLTAAEWLRRRATRAATP
jgi:hypothetical protein